MTKTATNRTLKSKLLLPGLLVANLLAFGILLWQDWGETPSRSCLPSTGCSTPPSSASS